MKKNAQKTRNVLMSRKILKKLSEQSQFNFEQYQVEHAATEKNIVIRAGAGTGKTYLAVAAAVVAGEVLAGFGFGGRGLPSSSMLSSLFDTGMANFHSVNALLSRS